MRTDISIAIITYNRNEDLCNALDYITKHKEYYCEVLLVDNGSSDNTVELTKSKFPDTRIIRLHKNTGVCEARNIAAINAKSDIVLFLDDDGYFDFNALPDLLEQFIENRQYAVVGCNIRDIEIDKSSIVFETNIDREMAILSARSFCGGAALVRRKQFMEVGMFPDYFFYSDEENDLSMRLFRKGYHVGYCVDAVMLHMVSPIERSSSRKPYYQYRNKQLVIWRNIPTLFAVIESLGILISGLLRSLQEGQLKPVVKGSIIGLLMIPRIIKRERDPMTNSQYMEYLRIEKGFRYVDRLKKLLRYLRANLFCQR